MAFCSAVFGGLWKAGVVASSSIVVFACWLDGSWSHFPNSPGLVAVGALAAALLAFLLVGVVATPVSQWRGLRWVLLALFLGGVGSTFAGPGGGGIQRGDISERWDGVIVSGRHLLVCEEEHGAWRLELPGGGGAPWSIGHVALMEKVVQWKVLDPGASFLPIQPGGKPAPFWAYLGGGGGDVTPVATMRTAGLMGGLER